MTFNPDADVTGSSAKRRGRGPVIAGGAGFLGIAVVVIGMITGVDLAPLLGGGTQGSQEQGAVVEGCLTGEDANEDDSCRLDAGEEVINSFWRDTLGEDYRAPTLVLVDQSTSTACGTASNTTGPFYCPPEETVYVDPAFWTVVRQQLGADAGSLAQLYVLAHEYGHHVQQLIGVFDQHPREGTGEDSNAVRTELQADCFAGSWVADAASQKDANGVAYMKEPTQQEIDDALEAAAAVGDDHIQEQSGRVNPESWTHGSSEQRQRWFMTGYRGGVDACDTFAVSGRDL